MSVIETMYCTQQMGGLTRGITSRAIQAEDASRLGKTGAACRNPRHTILRAIRYRALLRGWAFRPLSIEMRPVMAGDHRRAVAVSVLGYFAAVLHS